MIYQPKPSSKSVSRSSQEKSSDISRDKLLNISTDSTSAKDTSHDRSHDKSHDQSHDEVTLSQDMFGDDADSEGKDLGFGGGFCQIHQFPLLYNWLVMKDITWQKKWG